MCTFEFPSLFLDLTVIVEFLDFIDWFTHHLFNQIIEFTFVNLFYTVFKCSAFGTMYFPFRRLASSPTIGWEIPAGQRDAQIPQPMQSKDSSAHF